MFAALEPAMVARRLAGSRTLEDYLIARHHALDEMLGDVIERRGVTQVLELAAGLSPRGWRFSRDYGDSLVYLETDLAPMVRRKRAALERIGVRPAGHRVTELDALRESGPASLSAIVSDLDPHRGLAVVSEGLLSYLPDSEVTKLWGRLARALRSFSGGHYLFDLGVGRAMTDRASRAFRYALAAFVRGPVHEHFPDDETAVRACAGRALTRSRSSAPTARSRPAHLA
jgi:O-methyltransferase involved in polyketide biosynthesis